MKGRCIIGKLKQTTFIECGCCGGFHREGYQGDCRNDKERFTLEEAEKISSDIVYQEDLEDIY